jgi:rhomboid protease GluP
MAVGFTPHYTRELFLEEINPKQFLILALRITQHLGWKVLQSSDAGIIALSTTKAFKWKAKITIKIEDDRVHINSESTGNEMIDWGRNKKTVDRFEELYYELKYSVSAEEAESDYNALASEFTPPDRDTLKQPGPDARAKRRESLSLFIPAKAFFVTPIIVDINIAVFILMAIFGVNIIEPNTQTLLDWGANFRPLTLDGQWWRLFTCIFLHIGILHLLFNMYALIYIGILLEPRLGRVRFATAYILTGLVSSMASTFWHATTVSAGASGAIFGLYGVFLAMLSSNLIEKTVRKPLLSSIGIFIVFNLVFGLKAGIDNAAHLGGLLSGIVVGYLYYPGLKRPDGRNMGYAIGGAIAFTIITCLILYRYTSNDLVIYQHKMASFAQNENTALAVYRLPDGSSKEERMTSIQDSGIHYWQESLKLLNDVDKLDVPVRLKQQNQILKDYCNARLDAYYYMYRKLSDSAGGVTDSSHIYYKRVKAALDSLKQANKTE